MTSSRDAGSPSPASPALGYLAASLSAATSLSWGATLIQLSPRDAGTASYRATMTVAFLVPAALIAVLLGVHYIRRAHGHLPTRRPPRVRRSTLIAVWGVVVLCVIIAIKDDLPATVWLVLLGAVGWAAASLVLDRREYRSPPAASAARQAGRSS